MTPADEAVVLFSTMGPSNAAVDLDARNDRCVLADFGEFRSVHRGMVEFFCDFAGWNSGNKEQVSVVYKQELGLLSCTVPPPTEACGDNGDCPKYLSLR